jgi:hypothetical protein
VLTSAGAPLAAAGTRACSYLPLGPETDAVAILVGSACLLAIVGRMVCAPGFGLATAAAALPPADMRCLDLFNQGRECNIWDKCDIKCC